MKEFKISKKLITARILIMNKLKKVDMFDQKINPKN
jgi:hypothetical protein